MHYELRSANEGDKAWLDALRRDVYRDLMIATFGAFDEQRHQRHCEECWSRGNIRVLVGDDERIGMVQTFAETNCIELAELQVHPTWQRKQIGSHVLRGIIDQAASTGRHVVLSVARKNADAIRFYQRLGFVQTGQNDSHLLMEWTP